MPHRLGIGWTFGYAWPRDCASFWSWVFFDNQFYYARGLRCEYVRVFGLEISHVFPYKP